MADAVGARSVNAVDVFGTCADLDALSEAFAGLCRRAAEHGLVVHLEWLSWSKIPDLGTALRIVRSADQPNGGLNIDAWHFVRTGSSLEELRSVPGPLIKGIQLCDGSAEPEADLVEETLHRRALPGEGAFDLAGLTRALLDTGTEAPIGVEVFSDDLHRLPTGEAARRAAGTTRAVVGSRPLIGRVAQPIRDGAVVAEEESGTGRARLQLKVFGMSSMETVVDRSATVGPTRSATVRRRASSKPKTRMALRPTIRRMSSSGIPPNTWRRMRRWTGAAPSRWG